MRRLPTFTAALAASALLLSGCAGPSETNMVGGIRDPFVISTYGTGTSTYQDTAAVSDAVSQATGSRVRIITSDTAIGRMAAMKSGAAAMGRLGDEYIFAYEGLNEFANEDWGPQDTRVVWAPLSPHSLLTRTADGIETPADLKGKKVPKITANPSVNGKIDAYLAYGGLTRDDVIEVEMAYGEQPDGLQQGQIDMLYQQVYGASLYELESQMDVSWVQLDPDDEEAVSRIDELTASVNVLPFEGAPAQEEGEETNGFVYTLPITAMADTSEDEVYALVSAMAENFEEYENTTVNTPRWNPEEVEDTPREAPFHPGLIRWLEENDRWSDEAQQKQDELLERGERLDEEWEEFQATDPDPDQENALWIEWRAQNDLGKANDDPDAID
ncbi:TAXI family TRAP transporter solute-binding subunit [Brevibacterium yomogidense]|uniref:TRAP transporter solute receptor, TAXI family n=1 Tax=Brevibacterium yomogidense TaxID=946573 RepID=A0A1X6WVA2_9MICO|nr:TAXI family TRAP transporter solute-binding subunit [Brevibacterium yomogidense]SLM89319.1 TRAP transporter solute receptor, TAXI family precursor, unknown substrate 2 [Brevibacterium yomogidense]